MLGLAIGFGAQNLVKDFLSGVMMMIEDQYGVGDAVDLGEAIGTVEHVALRVTRVRDVDGTVWYVRNGEILRVGNQSQNWARTVLDINVELRRGPRARCARCSRTSPTALWDDEDYKDVIIEEPEVWGVQALAPDWVVGARHPEDGPDGAVGRRTRDAGADQGALRPRGHRDAGAAAPLLAAEVRRSRPRRPTVPE